MSYNDPVSGKPFGGGYSPKNGNGRWIGGRFAGHPIALNSFFKAFITAAPSRAGFLMFFLYTGQRAHDKNKLLRRPHDYKKLTAL